MLNPISKISIQFIIVAGLISFFIYSVKSDFFRLPEPIHYSDFVRKKYQIDGFQDLESGIKYSKQLNRPILLVFSGYACVSDRKYALMLRKPELNQLIQQNFVFVELMVDDRRELPQDEIYTVAFPNGKERVIRMIGEKNAMLQLINFKNNSQPFFVMVDQNINRLSEPFAYYPDKADSLLIDRLYVSLRNFNSTH